VVSNGVSKIRPCSLYLEKSESRDQKIRSLYAEVRYIVIRYTEGTVYEKKLKSEIGDFQLVIEKVQRTF
jgi:hypothetical protein